MIRRAGSTLIFSALLTLALVAGGRTQEWPLVTAELHAKASQQGAVRVLVQLDAPFLPEPGPLTPEHADAQRREIAAAQSLVRASLSGITHHVIREFDGSVPAMTLSVGADGLRMLESLRGVVTRVVADRPRGRLLVESSSRIQASQTAALGYDGTGTVIIVMDSGVDKTHSFFRDRAGRSRVVAEACFSSNDPSVGVTSLCPGGVATSTAVNSGLHCVGIAGCEHGTHAAGIAAGRGTSFAGVAPGADLVSIQVFSRIDNAEICGSLGNATPCIASYPSDLIAAGNYVRSTLVPSLNIAAMNLGVGEGAFSIPCDTEPDVLPAEVQLLADLRGQDVATVLASGNDGRIGRVTTAACIGSAISVGATTDGPGETIATFSNRAPGLSLLAPGVGITSSVPGGGFASASGTSTAAPHVAGAFAVLRQAVPGLTVAEALAALQTTGLEIAGFQRLRLLDALQALSVLTIQFSSATYVENEGDATHAVAIALTRTGDPDPLAVTTSTVLFSTGGGTATPGTTGAADYVPVVNQLVTFLPGETSKSVLVTIRGDLTIEPNETVGLTLTSPSQALLGAQSTATLTIVNDDLPGTIAFDQEADSVGEASGAATIVLRRTGGVASGVTAMVSTAGGSATPGVHYTPLMNKLVTFAAGADTATITVPIVKDTLATGDRTVGLQITGVSPGATLGNPGTATLTIVDDDVPGSVQFGAATYDVTEGTATVTITVNRVGGTASGTTVQYRVVPGDPGTATGGGIDYTLTPGTLSFGANETAKTFTVSIVNDTLIEPDETVNIELFNPSAGLTIGVPGTTRLTIHDNDAPTFRFGAVSYAVVEGAVATVTVIRAGGLGSAVTVGYQVTGGSASGGGVDYTLSDGTVTFPPGSTTQTIAIPTTGDTLYEGAETIVLQLVDPSVGTLATPDVTTVTVTDDDIPGTIQFGATAYRIAENAGLATVRITRTGTNLASEVTVQFTTINGTATAGADYVDATRMLTFAAGETFKDVTIQILDDSLPEGDETVLLTLSDPSPGAGLGTIRAAVLTIVDDEQALQFSAPVYVVNEAARTAAIGVTRTGPAVGTVTVDYASVAGSATAGADYTDVSGTLTFGAGITSRTFAVSLVSDTRSETAETIAFVLSNVTGGAQIGPLGTATVTIVDDDQPGVLRFSANAYTVSEAASAATIVVQRVLGATAGAVTVDYATVADGTASAGLDYLTTSGTLFFGAGETSKSFTVPILNDRRVEPAETLSVLLSNPSGGATLGTPSTTTLTIVDDDVPGTVSFSAPTYTVLEGAGLAIVTVKRSGGAAGGVTIDFTTADGSATGGLDYTPVSGTLSFGPGDTASVVAIPIQDDTTREGGETVRLILWNPTGGVALGPNDQAVLTITDNETGPVVGFGAMTFSVAENVAGGKANVTIVRAGSTLAGQSVLFSTAAGGTAAAGADYTPVVDQVVTFAAGQTGVTVQVPIVNNTSVDGDRTVNLALAPGGPNPILVGSPATAVLTILNDDSTLQFSRPSYSVSEGATASLIVTRTGGTLGSATVAYATANGTATAPGDYVATSGTLTFAPGVTSQTITIATPDDAVVEGSEFFTVTLASPTPAGTSLGSPSSATVTITDTDAPGVLQFATGSMTVVEGAPATVMVTRAGGTAGMVTVHYGTSDGDGSASAVAGRSYTATTGVLTFPSGVTSRAITVPTKVDSSLSGPRKFTVTLSDVGGGATLGALTTVVVGVTDLQAPQLQFAASAYAVREAAGSVTLEVRRVGPTTTQNTVEYRLTGVTATGGEDFDSSGGFLTFAPGATSRTITVPIVNDTFNEGAETFTVALVNPTGGAIMGTPSVATVMINDDDPAGTVQFGQLSWAVVEGGVATITVTRTGASGPVTVNYATSDGTATAPADYAAASGTLTFQAGEKSKTFTVATATDTLVEGPESVNLTLSSPTNGLALGTPSVATLWILDLQQSIQFGAATYAVVEGGTALLTVTRTGVPSGTVAVEYSVDLSSTAREGADFTLAPAAGTLTFGPGVTRLTIAVRTANAPAVEGSKSLGLRLTNPTGGASLGSPSGTQIALIDNRRTDLVVASLAGPAQAATGRSMMVESTVLNQAGGPAAATSLGIFVSASASAPGAGTRLALVPIPALAGRAKFTAKTAVTIPTGLPPGDYFLSAVADVLLAVNEVDETNNGLTAAGQIEIVLFQEDPVPGTVQFEQPAYEVTEDAVTAVITVARAGTAAGVTVQYRVNPVSPGTATGGGADYTLVPGTLTFAANETRKTFTVGIVNNLVAEPDKTIGLELVNPGGGAILGTLRTATLTIRDNDVAGTVQFSAATYEVTEGTPSAVITVTRAGGAASGVTVQYRVNATSPGTATGGGVDYTLVPGTLTFGANETSKTFTVGTVNNTVAQPDKTVGFELVNPAGGATLGAPSAAILTIRDDDVAGTVQFSAATYEVTEGTPSAVITVTRAGGAASGVTVRYRVNAASPGTATGGGVDYTLVPGTLTFGANETSKTFTVGIVNDTVVEGDETVGLELVNPGGGASVGTPGVAVLTIHDDDAPTFTFGAMAYSVVEGAVASVVVQRAGGVGSAVTVDYQVQASSTATGVGVDYTLADGTVTFGVGETSQTVLIPTLVDLVIEAPETIVLSLANPSAGVVGVPGTTTVTLADNDSAGTIELSAASYSVAEDAGLAVVRVTRTGTNLVGGVTVQFTTADGTATAGSDYLDATQVLTFAAGESFKDVQVQILADTTLEGNETISLSLSGASSGAVLGTIQTALLTILDGPPVTTLYVAPTGDDGNAGTAAQPWRTVEKARDTVRGLNGNMSADIRVILRGGEYVLPATVEFTAADSGSNGYSVIYQAAPGERPVLTGGQHITGWTAVGGGIYKAPVPVGSAPFRQLYANGSRAIRARTPNAGAYHQLVGWDLGGRTIEIAASEISDWQRLGQVEMVILGRGVNQGNLRIGSFAVVGGSAVVTASEPERTRIFEQVYPPKESRPYFFENALEFLDAPGEWYLDTTAGEVYYMPRPGESLGTLAVVVPRDLETLVGVRGDLDTPVHHIQFVGLTFEHTTWLVPNGEGYVGDQASVVITGPLPNDQLTSYPGGRLPGAIHIEGAHHTRLERNVLRHLGGSAVNYWVGTHDNEFVGNVITDVSGSGVSVDLNLEGNPADGRKISRNEVIRNNYIEKTGRDYYQTVGIMAGYTDGVVIEHNELHDMPYSGISVGWGWADQANAAQNNVVRYNRVWDVLNTMADGGALYTLSRQPGTVLAENYVFDIVRQPWLGGYEINGMFMDEGSNLITVRDNVFQNIDDQDIRFNNNGPSNTLINNEGSSPAVIANAGLEPGYADIRP